MSERKWTPGPWVVDMPTPSADDGGPEHDDPDCIPDLAVLMGSALRGNGEAPTSYRSGHRIIIREDIYPDEDPEAVANAHLIAAAPALFDALEAAHPWLERAPPHIEAQIDAALSLAKGGDRG